LTQFLTTVSLALAILAIAIAIPVAILFLEVFAAMFSPRREALVHTRGGSSWTAAVLVPAHNESIGVVPTLQTSRCNCETAID
jgi:hypothetical protein